MPYKINFFAKIFAHIKNLFYLCTRKLKNEASTITQKSRNPMIIVELYKLSTRY